MMYPRTADAYRDAYVAIATAGSYATAVPSSLDVLAALHRGGDTEATRDDVIQHCKELKLKLADTVPTERPAKR